ncbi:MAG: metal-dependent transcriptional regulator [Candidatus Heimdallarchaeota archaeon]
MSKDYQDSHEDYLKAIYLISKRNKGGWVSNSEIAVFLKVKPPSVTNMLYRLRSEGYIRWKPRKSIRLTVSGKQVATDIVRYNMKLKDFFKKILNVKDEIIVKELCCKIEHHITPEVIRALENLFLSHE